jgi:hypothetical protein
LRGCDAFATYADWLTGASRRHRPTDEAQAPEQNGAPVPEQNAVREPGDTTAARLAASWAAAPDDKPEMDSAVVRSRSLEANCRPSFLPDEPSPARAHTRVVLSRLAPAGTPAATYSLGRWAADWNPG